MSLEDNELIRGDSRTVRVTFKNADGTSRNLTGGTAYLTFNRSRTPTDDESAALQKVVDSFEAPSSGMVDFEISASDWGKDFTIGAYWMDAQLVSADGKVLSRKSEQITVIPDITRS